MALGARWTSSPILIIFLPAKSLTRKGLELGLVSLLFSFEFIPLPALSLLPNRQPHRWCPMDPSKLAKKKIERVDPDLIHELDNRYECIRRTSNKAELQTLLKFLDQLQFGSSLSVPPPSVQQKHHKETPPPSRNGYCYLYVQRHERLSRLNVSKLAEGPKFELVCDFGRSHPRDCLSPVVCFNVESEIYMVGDVYVLEKQGPQCYKPFFDVLSIDTGKSPSFLPCPPCRGTIASGFTGPKVDPLVVTLQGKIYVLALRLYVDQPSFEVFDNGKWETLPRPPMFTCIEIEDRAPLNTRFFFHTLYAWGHKIVVCLRGGNSFCFDTKTGKWINMEHIYKKREDKPVLQCVAEYNNFLIAKAFFSEELVVYELDANGYPHFYQNLVELEEMFVDSRILSSSNAFIIPFDDDADKFCFICSGPGDMDRGVDYFLRVAVFRMTISNLDGKEKLTAVLEAHQICPFYGLLYDPHICSAFLKRDNLNLDNLKADRSFGRAYLD